MEQDQTPADAVMQADLIAAIVDILQRTNSPAIQRSRELIAQRLAIAGDVAPSRIPAPRNITEIGGYINLLTDYGEDEQRARMLAAALGIAGPRVNFPQPGTTPPLFFAAREQRPPGGPGQPSFTLGFTMRSDFIGVFEAAVQGLSQAGAALVLLTPLRVLPPLGSSVATGAAQLDLIGRRLLLAPAAALIDPEQDPLSVSRPAAGGAFAVMARVLDAAAAGDAAPAEAEWVSWACTAETCDERATTDARVPLAPSLNAAGWFLPAALENPASSAAPGNWNEWWNLTGLVPGITRFGDELAALYPAEQILQSSVRDLADLLWTGSGFQ